MKKIQLKFRGKVLLYVLSAVVIIAGAVQYYINTQVSEEILASANEVIKSKVEGIKQHVEAELKMNKALLEVLADSNKVVEAAGGNSESAACDEMLQGIVANNEQFEAIVVTNTSGKIVASNMPKVIGVDLSSRKYFQEAIKGSSFLSEVVKSKASGRPVFGIALPVKNGDKTVGIIFAANKMDYIFENHIAPIKSGETGYGFITDKDGVLLAHPDEKLVLDKDFPNRASITRRIAENGTGMLRYWWEPIDAYKVVHIETTSNGWYICYTVPVHELLVSLNYINNLSLVGGVLLIGCISLVVVIVIGRVAKVVKLLNGYINKLAQGEVSDTDSDAVLQKALTRSDEFGEMSEAVVAIQNYYKEMSGIADSVAHKDLDIAVNVRSDADILGNSLKQMAANFGEALEQVGVSVRQVSQGAEQVSSASQELSAGAVEQVTHIERISNSLDQLEGKAVLNSDNAGNANRHASEANGAAVKGQEQMQNLSSAMHSMSERASEVQKIIKTIDDIAFQTNLLALNAAVEAARAGVHGKGFAVVAEEVRNLAARSAKAAGETAELIENVVSEINTGNSMTEVTADSLNNIAEAIEKTSDLVGEISASMTEQTDGIKEIGQVLDQIEHVAQSNSASSEQTASASEEMSGMSGELLALISEFKLASSGVGRAVARKGGVKRKRIAQNSSRPQAMRTPQQSDAAVVKPDDEIKLDDDEFGKF